jgi:hypothetical protein
MAQKGLWKHLHINIDTALYGMTDVLRNNFDGRPLLHPDVLFAISYTATDFGPSPISMVDTHSSYLRRRPTSLRLDGIADDIKFWANRS